MKKILALIPFLALSTLLTSCNPSQTIEILQGDSYTLNYGEELQLTAKVTPEGEPYVWTIESGDSVTLEATGLVKAIRSGNSVIKVNLVNDDAVLDKITIKVPFVIGPYEDPIVVEIENSDPQNIGIDDMVQLTAKVTAAKPEEISLFWEAESGDAVEVDPQSGMVMAKKIGTSVVKVTASRESDPEEERLNAWGFGSEATDTITINVEVPELDWDKVIAEIEEYLEFELSYGLPEPVGYSGFYHYEFVDNIGKYVQLEFIGLSKAQDLTNYQNALLALDYVPDDTLTSNRVYIAPDNTYVIDPYRDQGEGGDHRLYIEVYEYIEEEEPLLPGALMTSWSQLVNLAQVMFYGFDSLAFNLLPEPNASEHYFEDLSSSHGVIKTHSLLKEGVDATSYLETYHHALLNISQNDEDYSLTKHNTSFGIVFVHYDKVYALQTSLSLATRILTLTISTPDYFDISEPPIEGYANILALCQTRLGISLNALPLVESFDEVDYNKYLDSITSAFEIEFTGLAGTYLETYKTKLLNSHFSSTNYEDFYGDPAVGYIAPSGDYIVGVYASGGSFYLLIELYESQGVFKTWTEVLNVSKTYLKKSIADLPSPGNFSGADVSDYSESHLECLITVYGLPQSIISTYETILKNNSFAKTSYSGSFNGVVYRNNVATFKYNVELFLFDDYSLGIFVSMDDFW